MHLQLESETDVFDLDDVLNKGIGVQATTGAAGFGLPPVSVQWLEGAGNGAVFRGKRVLPRDIDLPLYFQGHDREHLKSILSRFAMIVAGECTLRLVEDDGSDWSVKVHRTGGGDYVFGEDTIGDADFQTVITFRAGQPFWTYSRPGYQRIENSGTGRGLLKGLTSMKVASSQAIGTILLENIGDADAYPIWDVVGPGRDFKALDPSGKGFWWQGALAIGETLKVDTSLGTVFDGLGVNRYGELAPAPRFWTIPPGTSEATASLENASIGTVTKKGAILDRNLVTNPRGETLNGAAAVGQIANADSAAKPNFIPTAEGVAGTRFQRWTTKAGTANAQYRVAQSTAWSAAEVVAGQTYTFMARVRVSGWDPISLPIRICDGPVSKTVMPQLVVTNVGSQWLDMRTVFVAQDSGNAVAGIGLYVTLPSAPPAAVDGIFDLAYWAVVPGNWQGNYFDGDTPASEQYGFYEWQGTAHASTSARYQADIQGRSSITCSWRPRKWLVI